MTDYSSCRFFWSICPTPPTVSICGCTPKSTETVAFTSSPEKRRHRRLPDGASLASTIQILVGNVSDFGSENRGSILSNATVEEQIINLITLERKRCFSSQCFQIFPVKLRDPDLQLRFEICSPHSLKNLIRDIQTITAIYLSRTKSANHKYSSWAKILDS